MRVTERAQPFLSSLSNVKGLYHLERLARVMDEVHFAYHRLLSRAVVAIGEGPVIATVGTAVTGDGSNWSLHLLTLTSHALVSVTKEIDDDTGDVQVHSRSSLISLHIDSAALITSDHILAGRDDSKPTLRAVYPFGTFTIERAEESVLDALCQDAARRRDP